MDCSKNSHERTQKISERMECPTQQEWNSILDMDFTESERKIYSLHIENCRACRDLLQSLNDQSQRQFNFMISKIDGQPIINTAQTLPAGLIVSGRQINGGSCVVVKAWDDTQKRFVAVKMSIQWLRDSQTDVRKMMNEAEAIVRLNHPNIVRLYETYPDFHPPAIAMEWVEGETLAKRLIQKEPTIEETLELIIEITGAIKHAHEHGILHRDVKPSNILLSGDRFSSPKLCDFGLAKFSRNNGIWSTATEFVGTPVFMAPEAFRNESGKIGPATDIYAIAAVMYQLITGKTPFEGSNPIDLGIQVLSKSVVPPRQIRKEIPRDLERICLKCLMKEPADRYASVALLEADLRRIQKGEAISLKPEGQFRRVRRWAKRDPRTAFQLFGFIGLLLVMIVSLATLLQQSMQSERKVIESRELARKRTLELTQAMSLAAPIFKRGVLELKLKPDEIKRIAEFAKLREDPENEPEDLKERLNHHYLTLELADSLRRISEELDKSIELTTLAKDGIGRIIKNQREAASKQLFLELPKYNFKVTVLEQALLRYGMACAQLYGSFTKTDGAGLSNVITHKDPEQSLIHEAIAAAEEVLLLNPEMDEAKVNLADYYMSVVDWRAEKHMIDEAIQLNIKAMEISDKLRDQYPNTDLRWTMAIRQRATLANLYLEGKPDPEKFLETLQPLEKILTSEEVNKNKNRLMIKNDAWYYIRWSFRPFFASGDYKKALIILDKTIANCPVNEFDNSDQKIALTESLNLLRLERIFMLILMRATNNQINEEVNKLEHEIQLISDATTKNHLMAQLFMFHPVDEKRNYKKAEELLKSSSITPEKQTLIEIAQILQDKIDVEDDFHSYESAGKWRSLGGFRPFMKIIFETEKLIKEGRIKAANNRFDLIRDWSRHDFVIPCYVTIRISELQKKLELTR